MTTEPTENLAALAALCMPLDLNRIDPDGLKFHMVSGFPNQEVWALTAALLSSETNGDTQRTVPFPVHTTDREKALTAAWGLAESFGQRTAADAAVYVRHAARRQHMGAMQKADIAAAQAKARAEAIEAGLTFANWLRRNNRSLESLAVVEMVNVKDSS